jgi:outer membrane protein FlgP
VVKSVLVKIWIVFLTSLLTACTWTGVNKAKSSEYLPKQLQATGFHAISHLPGLTQRQAKFQAEQGARMQAYRQLASQLYQEKLSEGRNVAAQVMADEIYRIYFDTYLRDAVLTTNQESAQSVTASLKLELTPQFYRCMDGQASYVAQCLQSSGKIPFTRIGYNKAESRTVNLACGSAACDGLFHVGGFNRQKNSVDRTLLNAGLADGEWIVNTSGRLVSHFILLNTIPDL